MTKREYLKSRGWLQMDDGDGSMPWFDPRTTDGVYDTVANALTVQRARDEEECRAVWAQFFASILDRVAPEIPAVDIGRADDLATVALATYRRRFMPIFVDDKDDSK